MRKKSIFAVLLISVLCVMVAGCSFNIGNMKKVKDKKIDPPTDKQVIKAVEAEYDGEGEWEITDSDEDDGDYVWELECEDGATAVVKWSDTDDEDDLYVKIDDSGVIIETTPEPTPVPTTEPANAVYSYTGYFVDTEDGNNTYPEGTTKIELWISGSEVGAVEVYYNNALFYAFSDDNIDGANEYLKQKGGYATFYVQGAEPFEPGEYTYYVYSPEGYIEYSDVCVIEGGSSTGTGSSQGGTGEVALDGLEQYEIADSSADISDICWIDAEVNEGIAMYDLETNPGLSFYSSKSSVCIDVYCYSLVDDDNMPKSDDELTSDKYFVASATLTAGADGYFEYFWDDSADETSMYIVIVSSEKGSKTDESYFYTACFVTDEEF